MSIVLDWFDAMKSRRPAERTAAAGCRLRLSR